MALSAVGKLVSRACVLAALGLACILASPRPAHALGCHVPDKPALGLSPADPVQLGTLTPTLGAVREHPTAQVRPVPCEGESPHTSARPLLPVPAAAAGPVSELRAQPSSALCLADAPLARPLAAPLRIDRPPRLSPPAA